ncbi:MAG: npcC 1 [Polaromonas sp.]|nr:npcC 1 [Polaromonas sp.]
MTDLKDSPFASPGYFNMDQSEAVVNARAAGCTDARLSQIVSSVTRHLHALVKEVQPTIEEWAAAIDFLTRTGQMCSDWRQEYILLSDVLGVSMLVDAINSPAGAQTTESTVLGPFHVANAPARAMGDNICLDGVGTPILVEGRVLDEDGQPVEAAELDVWQANGEGFYDVQQQDLQPPMNLRGVFRTQADGHFWFLTVAPKHYAIPHDGPVGQLLLALGRHPNRPAHIHFIVKGPGLETVTTHLFVEGDPYLQSDAVFGVKDSLIASYVTVDDAQAAKTFGLANPFSKLQWEFRLKLRPKRADKADPTKDGN